ncbi:MAG: hypothetical protein AABX35_01225 [Nanoarchaeota archaeon]
MVKLNRDLEIGYVRETSQVLPVLRETFKAMGFADDFRINGRKNVVSFRDNEFAVVSDLEYNRLDYMHNDKNPSVSNAFCIFPEYNPGLGLAFVREGFVEQVVVSTIHEFGHLLGNPLDNVPDEEAKAYAFVNAGANLIKARNIGGLGEKVGSILNRKPCFKTSPNHHMAHGFVANLVEQGMNPLDLYEMLCNRSISVCDSFGEF